MSELLCQSDDDALGAADEAEPVEVLELRDLGRETAQVWLDRNYAAIGERATLDLRAAYS